RDTGLCRQKYVSQVGEVSNGAPGKERRASVALIFREASARKPIRLDWGIKRDPPPEFGISGGGGGLDDQPSSDLASAPRACMNQQAGFTAARPAANWS